MPSINRIRVNNVKYNFGTQYYDDFTMRMYGKNTLYDLANGGGKSVLMLLLMQNMIPNCTLDEKQPIEKLFRTGNGNTTIHSLVEWKLDEQDRKEGYRYMTTGFCARKAKDVEGETAKKDVAAIEYFNYCIFYREYNKNDIINLPLSKDKERITFQGLRNYLKELEHRDMSLKVCIFDRKGEYQRFISGYGLHESQWEIIRGINKTEGHVRTYFETNYKTTRKVVEDLLIEGIIEKAYAVKTMRDGEDSDTMAKMLMDIKEQLTILAKKKKDITSYDHQAELIEVLRDKVASFMSLYQEQTNMEKLLADICVTGEEFVKNDAETLEKLEQTRNEKRAAKDDQRKRMECLKVARDKRHLEQLYGQIKQAEKQLEMEQSRLETEQAEFAKKESINEYLEYVDDRRKKDVWHGPLRNFSTDGWFRSLQKKHIPFDFVDFREETNLKDLEKYELLVYPHAAILTKERAEILTQYVANGGKLVMGCRTGYKDIYGRCPMQPMPGEAAELCGVTVEDFTFLAPGEPMEYVNWNGKRIPAPVFNDVLEPAFGGKAEGFFEGNYYDGKPALVTKNTGKGLAIYFGGCFAEETADAFLETLSIQTPAPWLVLPEGCELAKRGDQYFVLNYKAQACEITLKKKVTDRLTGNEIEGTYEVAPYGVLVLL